MNLSPSPSFLFINYVFFSDKCPFDDQLNESLLLSRHEGFHREHDKRQCEVYKNLTVDLLMMLDLCVQGSHPNHRMRLTTFCAIGLDNFANSFLAESKIRISYIPFTQFVILGQRLQKVLLVHLTSSG